MCWRAFHEYCCIINNTSEVCICCTVYNCEDKADGEDDDDDGCNGFSILCLTFDFSSPVSVEVVLQLLYYMLV